MLHLVQCFVTIQINTALKQWKLSIATFVSFVTIQINTALKLFSADTRRYICFVTIQINTALKLYLYHCLIRVCFVTIQINTALKPRRRFRNRAAPLSQTTDLNDFLYFYKFLIIIKSSSRVYCG